VARPAVEVVGEIWDIETIAAGNRLRQRERLRKLYGGRSWRKMKGVAIVWPWPERDEAQALSRLKRA
jgi:hypothetical protein